MYGNPENLDFLSANIPFLIYIFPIFTNQFVTRMNYTWHYEPPTPEKRAAAEQLGHDLGIHPALAGLLIDRGITTVPAARQFFRPQLTQLHDPFEMKDMDIAVRRLNKALGQKERILVYGDYDVDGCTAVALVYRFLQQYYSNIDYYIPDRYDEGYGVSVKGVDYAYATGVRLVIVLDCGIKAVEEIAYAREKGIDFIICDHHVPDDILPPACAILNAKRTDATYPYPHLSGCGVGFKFMQAFAKTNGIDFKLLLPLLDLVALKYAVMLSGVTDLIMMKSDCLDSFETIKVCTSYMVDGVETDQVPFDTYAHIEPVYTEFKGWNADLTGCRKENELPEEFTDYIAFMEKYLGVPIKIISLGPDRDATLMR